jgi:hypothetical protein
MGAAITVPSLIASTLKGSPRMFFGLFHHQHSEPGPLAAGIEALSRPAFCDNIFV